MNIGIIGLGTVGCGVVKTLQNFPNVCIKKIVVKNINKKRNIDGLNQNMLTVDPYEIVNDPEIDTIVEVAGGVDGIFDVLVQAIKNKKNIVTANKELLAKKGCELYTLADENGVTILFEASVGGGIPIIMPIKTALKANKITRIAAILNGTTNYILTQMAEHGANYDEVLKEAQDLGYAETDPTGDVEGFDASYKIAILASLAFKKKIDISKIYKEGITKVTSRDMLYASELGYTIKLIALAKDKNGAVDVRVHPMLVPNTSTLAKVNNVLNAITLKGFPIGEITFTGPGAGEFPTASAVVGDILAIEADKNSKLLADNTHSHQEQEFANQIDISQTENKYYISLNVANIPGVIGLVGTICGQCGINLSSLIQKGILEDGTAEVIVITEQTKEENVQNAISLIKQNERINKINNIIRVMD